VNDVIRVIFYSGVTDCSGTGTNDTDALGKCVQDSGQSYYNTCSNSPSPPSPPAPPAPPTPPYVVNDTDFIDHYAAYPPKPNRCLESGPNEILELKGDMTEAQARVLCTSYQNEEDGSSCAGYWYNQRCDQQSTSSLNDTLADAGACPYLANKPNDCGFQGITQQQCEERGCCWDPTNWPENWCYPRGPSVPSPPVGNDCYKIRFAKEFALCQPNDPAPCECHKSNAFGSGLVNGAGLVGDNNFITPAAVQTVFSLRVGYEVLQASSVDLGAAKGNFSFGAQTCAYNPNCSAYSWPCNGACTDHSEEWPKESVTFTRTKAQDEQGLSSTSKGNALIKKKQVNEESANVFV